MSGRSSPATVRAWIGVHEARASLALTLVSTVAGVSISARHVTSFAAVELPISVPLLLLLPAGPAVAVALGVSYGLDGVSQGVPRPILWPRLFWVTSLVTCNAALLLALAGLAALPSAAVLRNFTLLTAAALAVGSLVSPVLAWVLPAAYLMCCLMLGEELGSEGPRIRPWAVVLRQHADTGQLAVGVGALLVAVTIYVWRGARTRALHA